MILSRTIKPLIFAAATLLAHVANAQFYQGSNVEFGKNRVQYRDFDWLYIPSEHFEVYYYIGGEKLAEYNLRSCEANLPAMEKFFDYALEDKIQVLSYLKQSEYRQSNIGLTNDDATNLGGTARILGNKMFVYYEGDHALLEKQIKQNLARVVFSQMMYGGDWKDILKSNTLLSMPQWYEEGVIKYAAEGTSAEAEVFMRDLILSSKFNSLNRLYNEQAALAGQAFWSYIEEVYGASVIPNLLYMARLSRNVESGFLYVLGISLETVTQEFVRHYQSKYGSARAEQIPGAPTLSNASDKEAMKVFQKKNKLMGQLEVKYKNKYKYSQFKVSPNGENIAYVTNEMGQYKIWIYNKETGKNKRILKRDSRIDRLADESFPVLTWHPSGQILTYIFEEKGRAYIANYNLEEKEHLVKELFRIEKVTDMSYSRDGKRIVFAGVNRGQTDLYLYQVIGNNQEQLTNDVFDDVEPRFVDEDKRIIFASNRLDDTLRLDVPIDVYDVKKDIFIFDLENRSKLLERLTNTPNANEHHPAEYSSKHYTYMSNESGIDNRFLATIDSSISAIDTTIHYRFFTRTNILSDYSRSPRDYQFNTSTGNYLLSTLRSGKPVIYIGQKNNDVAFAGTIPAGETGGKNDGSTEGYIVFKVSADTLRKPDVDVREYVFENEKKDYAYEKETVKIEESTSTKSSSDTTAKKPVVILKPRNYKLNFASDFVVSQVTNNFGNLFYLPYSQPSSINPGLSALNKVGMSDLMEDYKIVGGFRLSGNLLTNTYGVYFENLRHRWDRKLTIQRQGELLATSETPSRQQTHSLTYQWKYPFNELSSVRFTGMVRNDRIITLSLDPTTLQEPNRSTNTVGLKAEYVFDNTIARGLNLYNGTRAKAWVEHYQQPEQIGNRSDFSIVGFDARHYQRIHRELIAAFRFSGASSFGYRKLVHYLGGVDNWMFFQKVDNSTAIAQDQNYQFQSFVGPMRGFWVNARNGSSFALANAEIRCPVFKYLMKKPIKSEFVENFQVVTFFDSGAAWTGKNPYSEDNQFNTTVDGSRYVTVTVNNNREPIIYGYGFGLRSKILGYFVRADWSWGVDDGIRLDRVFYLSMNLDF